MKMLYLLNRATISVIALAICGLNFCFAITSGEWEEGKETPSTAIFRDGRAASAGRRRDLRRLARRQEKIAVAGDEGRVEEERLLKLFFF